MRGWNDNWLIDERLDAPPAVVAKQAELLEARARHQRCSEEVRAATAAHAEAARADKDAIDEAARRGKAAGKLKEPDAASALVVCKRHRDAAGRQVEACAQALAETVYAQLGWADQERARVAVDAANISESLEVVRAELSLLARRVGLLRLLDAGKRRFAGYQVVPVPLRAQVGPLMVDAEALALCDGIDHILESLASTPPQPPKLRRAAEVVDAADDAAYEREHAA